jgi:hypothetical protein
VPWTPEKRAAAAERMRAVISNPTFKATAAVNRQRAWTPEKRAAASEKMRLVMSDPAVKDAANVKRQRAWTPEKRAAASEKMRAMAGMKTLAASPQLQMLRLAWAAATPADRSRFFNEIILPVYTASASSEPGGADEQPN